MTPFPLLRPGLLTAALLALCVPPLLGGAAESRPGLRILTRDDILASGARDLADLLEHVPGVRISRDRSRSFASGGPLVSSDTGSQLGASQSARVLVLFKGHSLNKVWFGGADQDWGTGFLEGLKEVRVYTGPATAAFGSGGDALDLVIDLVPLDGRGRKGGLDLGLSQSKNEDRLDRSLLHLGGGNAWGQDGQWSWYADFTQWSGEDLKEVSTWGSAGDRVDRKGPTYQVGGSLDKGRYTIQARHLQQEHFDPSFCGRRWAYTFVEGTGRFELPASWEVKTVVSVDRIDTRWGAASSATTSRTWDWDRVVEWRATARAEAVRDVGQLRLSLGADLRAVWVGGGADLPATTPTVMDFSARQATGGATLRVQHRLTGAWSLEGSLRVEKASRYGDSGILPGLTLQRQTEGSTFGLRYAESQRPQDLWYRVGSGTRTPGATPAYVPYLVGRELEPERNQELRGWLDQRFSERWTASVHLFSGRYSHLMGFDWDFALAEGFSQLRATEVGGYRYLGSTGSLAFTGEAFRVEANLSWARTEGAELAPRQLYLSADGSQPLYLSPVVGNLLLDWNPTARFGASLRWQLSGAARNGGIDLASGAVQASYSTKPFLDTESRSELDISLRGELWAAGQLQLTVRNLLGSSTRTVLVGGADFTPRGREIALTFRRRF